MKLDPVMAEIRAVREAYAEKFNGDITAMLDDIEKRTRESGRKTVGPLPFRPSAFRDGKRIRQSPHGWQIAGARAMETSEELNQSKVPIVKVNKELNKYDGQDFFPEKVASANEALRTIGLPKTAEKPKEQNGD